MKLMYFNQNHRWEVLLRNDPRKEYRRLISFYFRKFGISKNQFKIVMEKRN